MMLPKTTSRYKVKTKNFNESSKDLKNKTEKKKSQQNEEVVLARLIAKTGPPENQSENKLTSHFVKARRINEVESNISLNNPAKTVPQTRHAKRPTSPPGGPGKSGGARPRSPSAAPRTPSMGPSAKTTLKTTASRDKFSDVGLIAKPSKSVPDTVEYQEGLKPSPTTKTEELEQKPLENKTGTEVPVIEEKVRDDASKEVEPKKTLDDEIPPSKRTSEIYPKKKKSSQALKKKSDKGKDKKAKCSPDAALKARRPCCFEAKQCQGYNVNFESQRSRFTAACSPISQSVYGDLPLQSQESRFQQHTCPQFLSQGPPTQGCKPSYFDKPTEYSPNMDYVQDSKNRFSQPSPTPYEEGVDPCISRRAVKYYNDVDRNYYRRRDIDEWYGQKREIGRAQGLSEDGYRGQPSAHDIRNVNQGYSCGPRITSTPKCVPREAANIGQDDPCHQGYIEALKYNPPGGRNNYEQKITSTPKCPPYGPYDQRYNETPPFSPFQGTTRTFTQDMTYDRGIVSEPKYASCPPYIGNITQNDPCEQRYIETPTPFNRNARNFTQDMTYDRGIVSEPKYAPCPPDVRNTVQSDPCGQRYMDTPSPFQRNARTFNQDISGDRGIVSEPKYAPCPPEIRIIVQSDPCCQRCIETPSPFQRNARTFTQGISGDRGIVSEPKYSSCPPDVRNITQNDPCDQRHIEIPPASPFQRNVRTFDQGISCDRGIVSEPKYASCPPDVRNITQNDPCEQRYIDSLKCDPYPHDVKNITRETTYDRRLIGTPKYTSTPYPQDRRCLETTAKVDTAARYQPNPCEQFTAAKQAKGIRDYQYDSCSDSSDKKTDDEKTDVKSPTHPCCTFLEPSNKRDTKKPWQSTHQDDNCFESRQKPGTRKNIQENLRDWKCMHPPEKCNVGTPDIMNGRRCSERTNAQDDGRRFPCCRSTGIPKMQDFQTKSRFESMNNKELIMCIKKCLELADKQNGNQIGKYEGYNDCCVDRTIQSTPCGRGDTPDMPERLRKRKQNETERQSTKRTNLIEEDCIEYERPLANKRSRVIPSERGQYDTEKENIPRILPSKSQDLRRIDTMDRLTVEKKLQNMRDKMETIPKSEESCLDLFKNQFGESDFKYSKILDMERQNTNQDLRSKSSFKRDDKKSILEVLEQINDIVNAAYNLYCEVVSEQHQQQQPQQECVPPTCTRQPKGPPNSVFQLPEKLKQIKSQSIWKKIETMCPTPCQQLSFLKAAQAQINSNGQNPNECTGISEIRYIFR